MGHPATALDSPCTTCSVRELGFCGAILPKAGSGGIPNVTMPRQQHRTARARQTVYRANELMEGVKLICRGWAFSFSILPDGRRQILSFLPPGDFVSTVALLKERVAISLQALTDIRYCRYDRAELINAVRSDPKVFDKFSELCIAERDEANEMVADLGRRTADQRVARLILSLMTRLAARKQVRDDSFEFPLRQQHIADATGVTPVHVSRVFTAFRSAGLVEIKGRFLKVLNLPELRRISNAR